MHLLKKSTRKPSLAGSSRDIGLHDSGKGDAPRNLSKAFRDNYGDIFFDVADWRGFQLVGSKLRKVYR